MSLWAALMDLSGQIGELRGRRLAIVEDEHVDSCGETVSAIFGTVLAANGKLHRDANFTFARESRRARDLPGHKVRVRSSALQCGSCTLTTPQRLLIAF